MLRKLRIQRGWTHQEAADAMGISRSQFIKLERGERRLNTDYIRQAAKAFEVDDAAVISEDGEMRARIVGYVGAGAEAHFYSEADDPQEDAPMPPNGTLDTVGAEVRGSSLGHMFDRWIVFYDERHDPPTPKLYYRLCVVGLADGRVLVKKLIPSAKPGLYHLESQTEGTMLDQEILWAALVKALMPR